MKTIKPGTYAYWSPAKQQWYIEVGDYEAGLRTVRMYYMYQRDLLGDEMNGDFIEEDSVESYLVAAGYGPKEYLEVRSDK